MIASDLYFVREDRHMLLALEQSSFDCIVIASSLKPGDRYACKRLLEGHAKASSIPVVDEQQLGLWHISEVDCLAPSTVLDDAHEELKCT